MGQYYKFMNIDKKEVCQKNGRYHVKLTEHSYLGNDYCNDILRLLSNEWKGDRVLHVGDYAEPYDISNTGKYIAKVVKDNDLKMSVYRWGDSFEEVSPTNKKDIRYVYNLDKRQYVDLYKQPIQWCHYNDREIIISKFNSFALLTGCGNGQGGGDYRTVNKKEVGNWAGDRLVSSEEIIPEYKKFKQRKEIFNEMSLHYKNIKDYNTFTEKSIIKDECELLTNFIAHLKKHDVDISKLQIDDTGLLEEEKILFNDILSKEKELLSKEKGEITNES